MTQQTRGRNPGFAVKFRSRSAGISGSNPNRRAQAGGAGWTLQHGDEPVVTPTRRPASYLARLRSRSGSRSRAANRRRTTQTTQHLDDDAGASVSIDPSDKATSSQIEDLIEQHQLALKIDMIDMLDKHEKEIKFWKNKALKLKKKMSQETSEASAIEQDPAGNGNALQLQPTSSEDATGSEQGLVERVSMLEKEVENRDILIDSLRKTMEIQDKANEERVQLLEDQLERLVEMKTPAPAASPPPRLLSEFNNGRRGSDAGRSNNGAGGGNEVAVLEQLLARVLAEKDKLLFENQNLRSILRESELLPPENGSASPPRKGRGGLREEPATTGGTDGPDADSESKPPGQEYEYFRVLYQMSCKISPKNHRHIKYTGTCDGNVADTQQALKRIMEHHFSQVWTIIQEEGGSVSSSVHAEELGRKDSNDPVDFSTSSLARHVANHCQSFSSEREVVQWCRENIKVEIQQGVDAKLGALKKGERSKSRSKSRRKSADSQGVSRPASRAGSRQSEGSF